MSAPSSHSDAPPENCGIEEAVQALEHLAKGDPNVRVSEDSPLESVAKLKRNLNLAAREYQEAVELSHEFAMGLAEHFDVLQRVSNGDLAARVEGSSKVEFVELLKDVTNRTIESIATSLAERAMAEERQKQLEEQLLQSQKMEAIGRLAGGVAHDFNNILAVIIMCSDLALSQLTPAHPCQADVREIKAAGKRAGSLVSQLLAFSRKQLLLPEVLDLNLVITDLEKMLRRLLGEHIDLDTVMEPMLDQVEADPTQLQQVIVNLVVNAADAMPEKGHLLIRTSNETIIQPNYLETPQLQPGRHVVLEVSDSGIGMTSEVLSHIFEPFYTTKDVGKGTGLGLSTVYGIVNQSGGCITVSSEPSRGTTFKVRLPAAVKTHTAARSTRSSGEWCRGTETVLVVEDSHPLRAVAVRILTQQGYTVLEATNGDHGLRIATQHLPQPIDLLFTDMVMPLLGGAELAQQIRDVYPEIQVIYTSGYLEETADKRLIKEQAGVFIQKPYGPQELCRVVREVLDGKSGARRP